MPDGSLSLTRETSKRLDRARSYKVYLDGQVVGEIANGETKVFPVAPGQHKLRLRIDWSGSPMQPFSVEPGETVKFTCAATTGLRSWKALLPLFFFRRHGWVTLERL